MNLITSILILALLAFMTSTALAAEPYTLGPDSTTQPSAPQGEVTKHTWKSQKIFPGTEREYWIYVPKQYDAKKPACLMVFQDGQNYLRNDIKVPTVFDNLIAKEEMPVTIGLFIMPGKLSSTATSQEAKSQRSVEYDTLSDAYARFLLEEMIPELEKKYAITKDPAGRAICGHSSGGICAFTVAWQRPDAFGKVVSHCGSFTNIRGGNAYPSLIRVTEKKPIRVFLQSGAKDNDNERGNWPIANQDMASSLKFKGYDYQFVFGEGGHNLKQGGSIFPDTMRWLWRDFPKE
jgi:enterochelin esterase family protein